MQHLQRIQTQDKYEIPIIKTSICNIGPLNYTLANQYDLELSLFASGDRIHGKMYINT